MKNFYEKTKLYGIARMKNQAFKQGLDAFFVNYPLNTFWGIIWHLPYDIKK